MKSLLISVLGFLKKKIPSYNLFIALVVILIVMGWREAAISDHHLIANSQQQFSGCPESMNMIRLNNFAFTHPLLMSDLSNESDELLPLKNDIDKYIVQSEQSGLLADASVYMRALDDGSWMSINEREGFSPGSMIKLPVMICYLKASESDPGILAKKLSLTTKSGAPAQTFNAQSIEAGKSYTVRELLYYMVTQSDNNATLLLNQNLNIPQFQKLFADMGLVVPDVHDMKYVICASDYSRFMRVLYNATYLNLENSEYALSLLAQSSFKDGMVKQLPDDVKVAHKFGEQYVNGVRQLHESGIVYCEKTPYLLTVMTKGTDVKALSGVISEISRIVYASMDSKP